MRYFPRGSVDAPASLSTTSEAAKNERDAAKRYYATKQKKAFGFKVYKSRDVVDSLEKLFHGKCAYCESPISAVGPSDIEHYRPKGAISGETDHPGYWWLASDWNNLLPSCVDCNRARRKRFATEGMSIDEAERAALAISGKSNHFPIRSSKRAMSDLDDLASEDALLVDPTSRDPRNHIEWKLVNNLSLATARLTAGERCPYASTTIKIVGLNRLGLVEQRTRLALTLLTEISLLLDDVDMSVDMEGAPLEKLLRSIERRVSSLRERTTPESPYSECAKAIVDQALAEIVGRLELLAKQ